MAVRYAVSHDTTYRYAVPVSLARHVLHLAPRACAWQRVTAATLDIAPSPAFRSAGTDAFGNPEVRIAFDAPHGELRVLSRLQVTVDRRPWAGRADQGPAWEAARARLADTGDADVLDASRYGFESPHVRVKHLLADYALPSFPPGRPLLAAVRDLVARIHREFRYDPVATEVGTSVLEVLAHRHGVCQDFAHLAIGCLRSLGLPARYVSGYLCTAPPPGQPRLAGADATHAWFAAWCPGHGWVEFDPTNDCEADERFVLVGWGRDFGDVSPLRGVLHGGDRHLPEVRVTVEPVATAD